MHKKERRLSRAAIRKEKSARRTNIDDRNGFEIHRLRSPGVQVIESYPGSPMREVYAQWWRPDKFRPEYWEKHDWVTRRGAPPGPVEEDWTRFAAFLREFNVECHPWHVAVKLAAQEKLERDPVIKPLLLRIDYPLQKPCERVFEVDLHRVGEVLGYAYDVYAEIYNADDAARGGEPAPRVPGMLNREAGQYVWGHDMGDLAFEAITFKRADPDDTDLYLAEIEFWVGS